MKKGIFVGAAISLLSFSVFATNYEHYSFQEIQLAKNIKDIIAERSDIKVSWEVDKYGRNALVKSHKKNTKRFKKSYTALGKVGFDRYYDEYFYLNNFKKSSVYGCEDRDKEKYPNPPKDGSGSECNGDVEWIKIQTDVNGNVFSFTVTRNLENVDIQSIAKKVIEKYGQPHYKENNSIEYKKVDVDSNGFEANYQDEDARILFNISAVRLGTNHYQFNYSAKRLSEGNPKSIAYDKLSELEDILEKATSNAMRPKDVDI